MVGPTDPVISPDTRTVFQLPITYVDPTQLHVLSPTIVDDLELLDRGSPQHTESKQSVDADRKNMYMHLFQPESVYGKRLLGDWAKHYTSDTMYLNDTQVLVQHASDALSDIDTDVAADPDPTTFHDEWNAMKTQHNFMEKYNFIEWGPLRFLNQSPAFLQMFSMINLSSPVLSLLLPIVFLVVPFVILRIRGISLTLEEYINVLADIARHHFIGKAIATLRQASFEKWIYGGLMFGFYALQIYQNITSCQRFYHHLTDIQKHLLMLKAYAQHSAHQMNVFVRRHQNPPRAQLSSDLVVLGDRRSLCEGYSERKPSDQIHLASPAYQAFCVEVARRSVQLQSLYDQLSGVHCGGVWTASTTGWSNVGYMLQCYYDVHHSTVWNECIQYSMGFRGWQEHMGGLSRRWRAGDVGMATFTDADEDAVEVETKTDADDKVEVESKTAGTKFTQQYYLPLGADSVKNDGILDRNMLLTGPNASGKTTYLKTTLLNVILTQQIGCGCYKEAHMPETYTHLHSYLNIPDTSERDSLFQAEARRCKEILDAVQDRSIGEVRDQDRSIGEVRDQDQDRSIGEVKDRDQDHHHRHFCIFDELYSGTNPKEATKSAFAFLKYLSRYDQVDFLLTTHYTQVCEDLEKEDRIQVCQMMVESDIVDQDGRAEDTDAVETNAVHRFTYRIEPGISHVEGATQILTSMGYPAEILASMRESKPAKSTQIEAEPVCKKSRVSHKPQKKVRQ